MESRLTLLGLLSAGPGHGYDLKRSWDHWFAASKPLAYGQVYATLARLVRDGLITQIETEPGAGPERKRYEVTDVGRQSVEQWLLTPVTPAGDVQADIFAKTVIALMLDDDAGRLRAVVDQIASLTDTSARTWHARLCGLLSQV